MHSWLSQFTSQKVMHYIFCLSQFSNNNFIQKTVCNKYIMALSCVSVLSDLNPEIAVWGEAEGCYWGVKGWYCWYAPRSHATYNIHVLTGTSMLSDIYTPFSICKQLASNSYQITTWLHMLRLFIMKSL